MIVCLTPPQMNDFCDLLGTPYAPVSKIAPVNGVFRGSLFGLGLNIKASLNFLGDEEQNLVIDLISKQDLTGVFRVHF